MVCVKALAMRDAPSYDVMGGWEERVATGRHDWEDGMSWVSARGGFSQ